MRKDVVASLDGFVTREAGFELRIVERFAILIKLSEPPARRRGVLFRVLDHELQVPLRSRSGNEGLGAAKDLVVLL